MNNSMEKAKKEHALCLKNREELEIWGIDDVTSFDEELVEALSAIGVINIEGTGLHISKLDIEGGSLTLSGRINGIYYQDAKPEVKRGLFGGMKK